MKKCKFCAEEIQQDAIYCKHCKMMQEGDSRPNTSPKKPKRSKVKVILIPLLSIGLLGAGGYFGVGYYLQQEEFSNQDREASESVKIFCSDVLYGTWMPVDEADVTSAALAAERGEVSGNGAFELAKIEVYKHNQAVAEDLPALITPHSEDLKTRVNLLNSVKRDLSINWKKLAEKTIPAYLGTAARASRESVDFEELAKASEAVTEGLTKVRDAITLATLECETSINQ